MRLYSWAIVLVYLALGGFLVWASGNLETLTSDRQLNYQEVEMIDSDDTPIFMLGAILIVSALAIGAASKVGGKSAALLGVGGSATPGFGRSSSGELSVHCDSRREF